MSFRYEDARLSTRFWSKTRLASTEPDACWVWVGVYDSNGTPKFNIGKENLLPARLAYKTLVGPMEGQQHLRRVCKNRACVHPGPAHAEPIAHTTKNQHTTELKPKSRIGFIVECCTDCRESVVWNGKQWCEWHGNWGDDGKGEMLAVWSEHRHQPGRLGKQAVVEMAAAGAKGNYGRKNKSEELEE